MTYLKGVYWDLDGTIANTELEAHLPAFNFAFNDFGLEWYWDKSLYIDLLKINGGKKRIVHFSKIIKQTLSEDVVIKLHERKQFHYLEIIKNNAISPKTGVYRLIHELYKKKVRQFIVTSSSRKQVDLLISYLFNDLNPFEFIISSDDVNLHKPHPSPYLKAIEQSSLKVSEALVFEDSIPGIKAALAANLPTIYVPSNIPTVIDKKINLDFIVNTLGDEENMSKVIKGPKLENKFVDYNYLQKLLMSNFYAKD